MSGLLALIVVVSVVLSFVIADAGKPPPPPASNYIIVPVSEGGMKCMLKKDYSEFCIMPPGYNMRAQVFKTNADGTGYALVTTGITVTYAIENNTYSQNGPVPKTNFWTYASNFGWNLAMDIGTKGYGLSGTMVLNPEGNGFIALKVPQVPFLDGSITETAYQNGIITVKNSATGAVLATQKFVMPGSTEQRCYQCHGGTGGADTDRLIVSSHDSLQGTTMSTDGHANLCADCHADPSIGKTGVAGVPYLSTSMHSFHAGKMPRRPAYTPVCYYCHPGLFADRHSECNRGAMAAHNKACDNAGCHGSISNVGSPTRIPWSAASLPRCDNCHSTLYSENAGRKYADSMLTTGPDAAMNGKIWCQTCHGAQHAEWPSTLAADNQVPLAVQGTADVIGRSGRACQTCHIGSFSGLAHR